MKNDFAYQKKELKELTDTMIAIAIKGTQESENEPLILVYGLILDCAHRIRQTIGKDFLET